MSHVTVSGGNSIGVSISGPGQIAAKVTSGVGPQGPPGFAFLWTTVQTTASLDNFSAGTRTVLRLDAATAHSVTGFTSGGENAVLRLVNVGTNTITLVHNGTASDAENRLLLDTGTNRSLEENDQAELLYDPVSLRWRVTPCCGSPTS